MHDLRAAVYRHLQRLSLAFFTRTRTGEVQSRIANDIGGVQNVVTSHGDLDRLQRDDGAAPRSSRCSRSTGAWRRSRSRCCRSSSGSRAASARERKRITAERQGRLADMSLARRGVAVGQRHPARQDDGPRARARRALHARVGASWPTSRCARAWPAAGGWRRCRWPSRSCRRSSTGSPASSIAQRRRRDLDRHGRRLHHAADAAVLPAAVAASASASTSRPRWRSSTASSSTSTCRSTSPSARTPRRARATCAARSRFEDVAFGYDADAPPTLRRRRPRRAGRDARPRSWGRPARARRRSATSSRACTTPTRGRVTIDGVDVRDLSFASLARDGRPRLAGDLPLPRQRRENLRFAKPDATDEELEDGRARRADPRPDRVAARRLRHDRRRARLPLLAAARSSASRSRAPSCATRRCSSSTRPRARWTPRPSARCRRRSTAWPRAARRSPSPTACRPSATPTRSSSSTRGRIAERGTHDELLARGGRYATLAARDPRARRRLSGHRRRRPIQ